MVENENSLDLKEFGKRCSIIRKKLGLTQKDMAKQINTSQYMISKIEAGSKVMSPLVLKVLSFFSQSVSLDRMFSKNFNENDKSIINNQYAFNSIIKAKLGILKEELLTNIDKSKSEIEKQIDEANELL